MRFNLVFYGKIKLLSMKQVIPEDEKNKANRVQLPASCFGMKIAIISLLSIYVLGSVFCLKCLFISIVLSFVLKHKFVYKQTLSTAK